MNDLGVNEPWIRHRKWYRTSRACIFINVIYKDSPYYKAFILLYKIIYFSFIFKWHFKTSKIQAVIPMEALSVSVFLMERNGVLHLIIDVAKLEKSTQWERWWKMWSVINFGGNYMSVNHPFKIRNINKVAENNFPFSIKQGQNHCCFIAMLCYIAHYWVVQPLASDRADECLYRAGFPFICWAPGNVLLSRIFPTLTMWIDSKLFWSKSVEVPKTARINSGLKKWTRPLILENLKDYLIWETEFWTVC